MPVAYHTVGKDQVLKILCFHHIKLLVHEFIQEQDDDKEYINPQLTVSLDRNSWT